MTEMDIIQTPCVNNVIHMNEYTMKNVAEITNHEACSSETPNGNLVNKSSKCMEHMDASKFDDENRKQMPNMPTARSDDKDTCWFDILPTEIIQIIFSHLSTIDLCKASLVSKKWCELAKDPIYWQKIELKNLCNIESICSAISKMPLLKEINFQGLESINADELKCILTETHQVISLDFGFLPGIGRDIILVISENLPKVEILNVEGSRLIDTTCVTPLNNLKSLTKLNLSHCTVLYDFHVQNIVSNLPYLQSLNLDGIACVSDETVKKIWQVCGTWLEELYLDGAEITDYSLEYLSHCSELHTFSLSFGENITDTGIGHFTTWKNIRKLHLRKCVNVTADCLAGLFSSCENLHKLMLLDLSECSQITDAVLVIITEKCTDLEQLTLCWCWELTDDSICSIVSNCSKLDTLDLTGIDKITGPYFKDIPEKIPNLRYFDLRQCNQMQDELIANVVSVMPHLEAFNYYGEKF